MRHLWIGGRRVEQGLAELVGLNQERETGAVQFGFGTGT